MTQRRHFLGSAAALTASASLPLLHSQKAFAQNFPSRTIRYICPWTAGGTTDIVMRVFAESASKVLNQTVIVDNKPGAGGTLGAVELVNAKPALSIIIPLAFKSGLHTRCKFDTKGTVFCNKIQHTFAKFSIRNLLGLDRMTKSAHQEN
jgi:tripartite-type tricarboxylate transporter receptor subunit TctC